MEPGIESSSNELDHDYTLLCLIGRGGYGEVWLARDRRGGHWAVKIVYRSSFDDEKPFRRELDGIRRFMPISRISSAQMFVVHVGESRSLGCFYYIMELADDASGESEVKPETYQPHTLRHELRTRHRIPAREAVGIGWSLSHALECLHARGVVHRDVKPGNIIFVGGRPKLADVGLVTSVDKSLTFAGTEGYLPPEGPGSFQADVYALGITLYEACTGCDRRDFPCLPGEMVGFPDHAEVLALMRVINKACEPNLGRRYKSAGKMRADLEGLLTPGTRFLKRSLVTAVVGVGALAAICCAGVVWKSGRRGEPVGRAPVVVDGRARPDVGSVATGVVEAVVSGPVVPVDRPGPGLIQRTESFPVIETTVTATREEVRPPTLLPAPNPEFQATVAAIRKELGIALTRYHLCSVSRARLKAKFDVARKPAPRIKASLDAAIAEEEVWRTRVVELNARLRSVEQ